MQTSSAPVPPSTGKAQPAAGQRLTGQVEAGVEPGCLVLTGARGTHLLIVPAKLKRVLEAGDTVTITGRAEPGMVTTCQQGTPFVVTAVE
ncbi:MAG TPA: hypothetical protein VFO77_07465 [Actinoplanes sp.]|nr:hypothetical protein [Actinoplanes sp.]